MQNFFDPTERVETLIPMFGSIHLTVLIILLAMVPLMIWQRKNIVKLASNRQFMKTWMISYMVIEGFYWFFTWYFKVQPFYERLPFHLCGSLSVLLPILVLTNKQKALSFFSSWALGAGFIAFINPSFIHDAPLSFAFIHYLIRHYFVFLLPIFLYIGGITKIEYRKYIKSVGALALHATLMFLVNWAAGTNFLHLGKDNPLDISFLPETLKTWPYTLPTFIAVGVILLHIIYGCFALSKKVAAKGESYDAAA